MHTPARFAACCLAIAFVVVAVEAQEVKLRGAEAAMAGNQRALKYYRWKSRREIVIAGDVQQVVVFSACFDDEGNVVKVVIEGDSEGAGGARGPLGKRRAKKKKQKVAEFGEQLEALVQSYTEMDTKSFKDVLRQAKIRREADAILVQARNVVRQGDTMNISIDEVTKLPRRFEVMTSLAGEPVRLTVEFTELGGRPSYPSRTVVETELKEDKLTIVTENYDYEIR